MKNLIISKTKLVLTILVLSFLLMACRQTSEESEVVKEYNDVMEDVIDESVYVKKVVNPFTDDDEDNVAHISNNFKPENTAVVRLDDDQTIIDNVVEETDIYMENGNLIVQSTKKFTLVVTGTLNGSIIVYKADGKFQLVLDGVDITSTSGPAINIQSEKRSFLVINPGTVNNIIDGTEHPELSDGSNTNGAIFSEEQLIISGGGILNVTARYKHGIVSDDYIKIVSGNINILDTASDGLHANDYIVIDGGVVNINANSNGLECEKGHIVINGGRINITAVNDGIKTSYHDGDMTILPVVHIMNGIIHIEANKEGITATSDIILQGGALEINSVDDALSSDRRLHIIDGINYLHSLEKQALDGDIEVLILGGTSLLFSDGLSAVIESDDGFISIEGGLVVAAGPVDIDISLSTQGYIKYGNISEYTTYDFSDDSSLLTIAFIHSYPHLVISHQDMVEGSSIDIYTDGLIDGNNFFGYYVSGSYSDGTLLDSSVVE